LADAVRQLLARRDNDYSALAAGFQEAFEMPVWAPLGGRALPCGPALQSVSVVIPAWRAASTIGPCLDHLAASTINRDEAGALEVIVVDDGSDDGTWERLQVPRCDLELLAVRQEHRGRAPAMNVGAALAAGDIVVSCDADMLLLPSALEELRVRLQFMPSAVVVGFRTDVDPGDEARAAGAGAPVPGCAFGGDTRLAFDWPGWPESICLTTAHFERYGRRRRLWMPSGDTWDLTRMVFGCLFGVRRSLLLEIDGYDERFAGWGWEDALFGARSIAMGAHVVPAYGAAGFHLRHALRSRRQWREGARNRAEFERLLGLPPAGLGTDHVRRARSRVVASRRHHRHGAGPVLPAAAASPDHPGWAEYHLRLGFYEIAAALFSRQGGDRRARLGLARALRLGGRPAQAVAALCDAAVGGDPEALVELALARARAGDFPAARAAALRAEALAPRDRLLRFVLRSPRGRFLRRARRHWRHGFADLAIRDLEAVLIQDPSDTRTAELRSRWMADAPGSA
jgi:glycosyltransferase involved in cell wall biosynthesis